MSVIILDAGSQYSKLIQRRCSELGISSVIEPLDSSTSGYSAIIISGGPMTITDSVPDIDLGDLPVLGICYGMQYLAYIKGGELSYDSRQDGQYIVNLHDSELFKGLSDEKVLLTHGVSVTEVPCTVTCRFDNIILAFQDGNHYGVQFHPEVDLTPNGQQIFRNFLYDICQLTPEIQEEIKVERLDQEIICLVSGGVDSTVPATLLSKENQIRAIHIDNGFLRKNESALVAESLRDIGIDLEVIDASDRFYRALKGVIEPERKRKIIGDVFAKIAKGYIGDSAVLAQGTLRPDLIESGHISEKAETIKTHHNDSPMIRRLRDQGRIIEPLKELHKDQVRDLGRKLGLPDRLVDRMPFPGPGLAIRILCSKDEWITEFPATIFKLPVKSVGVQGDCRSYNYVTGITEFIGWPELVDYAKRTGGRVVYVAGGPVDQIGLTRTLLDRPEIELVREADWIATNILDKHDQKVSQMPVVLLPVTFDKIGNRSLVIRTIITNDFMTGQVAVPGIDISEECVDEMMRELAKIPGVSRVMYDLTSKPPGTTEWE